MNERVSHILKSPWTIPVIVGVTAFGGGLGVGYILGRRATAFVFEEETQLEFDFDAEGLAEEREKVQRIIDEEAYLSPVTVPETDAEVEGDSVIVRSLSEGDDVDPELIQVNVFEQEDFEWNWEVEIDGREEDKPYILHRDEFHRNEEDFTQRTLTYYEADDILADEDNEPVFNKNQVTGSLIFGHGSGDPNVVYIRNSKFKAEYEVLRHPGRYELEVMGLEIEEDARASDLKHSHRVGKFRDD